MVCPDVFVVKGVAKELRPIYKLWEERQAPSLVIEVTSAATRMEDLDDKKAKYIRIGVAEYFLFDPLGEHLQPRLQGFLLADGGYRPFQPIEDGSLVSQMTGLRLQLEGERLRLVDLASGEKLLWAREERVARQAAEVRARAAEEEILRLRRELAERPRND